MSTDIERWGPPLAAWVHGLHEGEPGVGPHSLGDAVFYDDIPMLVRRGGNTYINLSNESQAHVMGMLLAAHYVYDSPRSADRDPPESWHIVYDNDVFKSLLSPRRPTPRPATPTPTNDFHVPLCPTCQGTVEVPVGRPRGCFHSSDNCPCGAVMAPCPDCSTGRAPCAQCGVRDAEVIDCHGDPVCRPCSVEVRDLAGQQHGSGGAS